MSTTTLNQENIIKKVFDPTTQALTVTGSVTTTPPVGAATEAKQDDGNASLAGIFDYLTPLNTHTTTTTIDTSVTSITNSSFLTVVAATNDVTIKIQSIEDIGEFMALYVGALGFEIILAALPLGGGEINASVPNGARISIKSLGANVTQGKILFNLIK